MRGQFNERLVEIPKDQQTSSVREARFRDVMGLDDAHGQKLKSKYDELYLELM